jgi:hypothetical protein
MVRYLLSARHCVGCLDTACCNLKGDPSSLSGSEDFVRKDKIDTHLWSRGQGKALGREERI